MELYRNLTSIQFQQTIHISNTWFKQWESDIYRLSTYCIWFLLILPNHEDVVVNFLSQVIFLFLLFLGMLMLLMALKQKKNKIYLR